MVKKIIIGVIALNVLLAGWFLKGSFLEFFSKTKEVSIESQESPEKDLTEGRESQNIFQKEGDIIGEGEIKIASYNEDKIVYYNRNNFLETDSKGSFRKNLATFPFPSFSYGKCSSLGNFCLINSKGSFSVFDLKNKSNFELEKRITEADFNSQGDGLVYLFKEGSEFILNSSDLDGKNWIRIKSLKGENIKVEVSPKDNKLVFYSSGGGQRGLFLTSLLDNSAPQRISDSEIIDALFSPDGKKIIFSHYESGGSFRRVQLSYYDLNQKKQYDLGLPGIAQKCAWFSNSKSLICAVLASESSKEFSLEDWYAGSFVSRDVFWEIDLAEGERKKVFADYSQVDSSNLMFVEGDKLLFLDKISGALIAREL